MDPQNNQQVEIPTDIHDFLESILSDAGMTSLDESMHEEMIRELYARLDSYISSAIVKHLDPEASEEFIKMSEDNKPREELEKFLTEKIPNAPDVLAQTFAEFRSLYLGNVATHRASPMQT